MTHQELSYNASAEESLILLQSNYLLPRPLQLPQPTTILGAIMVLPGVGQTNNYNRPVLL